MEKIEQQFLNMKLRYFGITAIKQQLEFHYKLILVSIKFHDFNLRSSYISRVLNFAILGKSRNLVGIRFILCLVRNRSLQGHHLNS